jgi:hypothetical protein
MDSQDGRVMVIFTGKHGGKRTFFKLCLDGGNFRFDIGAQAFIVQLSQLHCVLQAARKNIPVLHLGFQGIVLFHHLLSLGWISPKIRHFYFLFELR